MREVLRAHEVRSWLLPHEASGPAVLPLRSNSQQGKRVYRRGVDGAVVGHDQRHDHMQRRERAIRKCVETVARPQRPVGILGLGSFEIEEVRVLDGEDPQVGHLFGAGVKPNKMMEIPGAETRLVVDAHRGVNPAVGPDADRAPRIRVLAFDAVAK